VLWGISWINIQMMLADMPRYEHKKKKDDEKAALAPNQTKGFNSLAEIEKYMED